MRDKNIFIRKENAFSCLFGNGLPVFANVTGYHDGIVVYEVNYLNRDRSGNLYWRYDGEDEPVATYATDLDSFLKKFRADIYNEYDSFSVVEGD